MNNKFNRLIFISSFLVVFLLLVVLYIGLNKKDNKEVEPVKEKNKIVSVPELDSFQLSAYNSIITSNKYYGFYYNSGIEISDISSERMMKYALSEYILNNNIEVKGDLSCFINPDTKTFKSGDMKNPECKNISIIKKEDIDKLIKVKFNSERVFDSPNEYGHLALDGNMGYIYDGKGNFYVGNMVVSTNNQSLFTKFVKAEKDDENLYIYDKAFVCSSLTSGKAECKKGYEDEEIIFSKDYNPTEALISEVTNDEYNLEFIINSYDSLINTYKHTFKKRGNNYYWISSVVEN